MVFLWFFVTTLCHAGRAKKCTNYKRLVRAVVCENEAYDCLLCLFSFRSHRVLFAESFYVLSKVF